MARRQATLWLGLLIAGCSGGGSGGVDTDTGVSTPRASGDGGALDPGSDSGQGRDSGPHQEGGQVRPPEVDAGPVTPPNRDGSVPPTSDAAPAAPAGDGSITQGADGGAPTMDSGAGSPNDSGSQTGDASATDSGLLPIPADPVPCTLRQPPVSCRNCDKRANVSHYSEPCAPCTISEPFRKCCDCEERPGSLPGNPPDIFYSDVADSPFPLVTAGDCRIRFPSEYLGHATSAERYNAQWRERWQGWWDDFFATCLVAHGFEIGYRAADWVPPAPPAPGSLLAHCESTPPDSPMTCEDCQTGRRTELVCRQASGCQCPRGTKPAVGTLQTATWFIPAYYGAACDDP